MNTPLPNGGATPDSVAEQKGGECQGIRRHFLQWIWVDGEWTNRLRCTTCGITAGRIVVDPQEAVV